MDLQFPSYGLVVDGSTRGNPGPSKYKVYDLATKKIIFESDWIGITTNNITEFLAICHAVYILEKNDKLHLPIYSDSQTALSWVFKKQCQTQSTTLQDRIKKAIKYISNVEFTVEKWHTSIWGENPADFGNKH